MSVLARGEGLAVFAKPSKRAAREGFLTLAPGPAAPLLPVDRLFVAARDSNAFRSDAVGKQNEIEAAPTRIWRDQSVEAKKVSSVGDRLGPRIVAARVTIRVDAEARERREVAPALGFAGMKPSACGQTSASSRERRAAATAANGFRRPRRRARMTYREHRTFRCTSG